MDDVFALALHVHHPEQQRGNQLCFRVCIYHKPPEDGGSYWFPSTAGKKLWILFLTELPLNHLDMSHLQCLTQQNSMTMTFFSIAITHYRCWTLFWKRSDDIRESQCIESLMGIVSGKIDVLVKRALDITHSNPAFTLLSLTTISKGSHLTIFFHYI